MSLPPGECIVVAGNVTREKSELDKGTDADGEHAIEQIVDVLPVVNRLAPDFTIDTHIVMKEAMEAQIPEATLIHAKLELFLPIGAQSFVGSSSADTTAPVVIQRNTWDLAVYGNVNAILGGWSRRVEWDRQ